MNVNITIKLFLLFILFDNKISTDRNTIKYGMCEIEILKIQNINGHRNYHAINLIVFFEKRGVSLILYLMTI